MTDETVDCFNCGRPNPDWAQVCRSCGVALRHGEARTAPAGPFPTDRDSLVSMAAVIGTILLAVVLGLFVSGLNPTASPVSQATPTPSPTLEPSPTPEPEPTPTPEPEPTPTPEPELRGTLTFGTGLDDSRQVTGETDAFTPANNFAYSLSVPGGVGGSPIRNQIERVSDPSELVVDGDEIPVDPDSEVIGFNLGSAAGFVRDWGSGEYVWRIFVGDELVAEATFRLAEG
jgi:hypothetical protein